MVLNVVGSSPTGHPKTKTSLKGNVFFCEIIMYYLHIALIYLATINVVTFFVYGIDKAASKRGQSQVCLHFAEREHARTKSKWKSKRYKWRVSEATLLGLTVLGGSIGAWLGMKAWHHKTLHKKFRYGVPFIFIAQVALVVWIYSKIIISS